MPNRVIFMNTLRSILRLHLAGKGSKTISNIIYTSRATIRKYIARYYELGLTPEELLAKSDSELAEFFGLSESMRVKSERQLALEQELPDTCKRLVLESKTSRAKLHKEYLERHPDGYSYAR